MPGLREQNKRENRERILAAARKLFLSQGVPGTSVDQIAATAGVSRATLFNYFAGKDGIITALSAGLRQRLLGLIGHYAARPGSTAERVRALFDYSAQVIGQTGHLTRMLFAEEARRSESSALFTSLVEAFTGLVRSGQELGDVRSDAPPGVMAEMLLMGFMAGIMGWVEASELPLSEQFRRRAEFIIQALSV